MIISATEVQHEDVKAFMNAPDEPKTPEPMIMDDWQPEEIIKDVKKTTEDICRIALHALNAYNGEHYSWSEMAEHIKLQMLSKAAYWISTAANPNRYEECSKMHDLTLEAKLKTGWRYGEKYCEEDKTDPYLLPYRSLPLEEKTKDFLFSSIVISLLQVWKGH